jgi:TetR/AcrR family transcriptional regulator, cholesterol catabolism regulator
LLRWTDVTSNQSSRRASRAAPSKRSGPRGERGKRHAILTAATERFGRDGYEHTKWADIAADVGVGPTALYHYFESKLHCLYVIMDEAIEDFRTRFARLTGSIADPRKALAAVLQDCFDLTEHEVLRNRVLVAEQGLLAVPRKSPREEAARQAARARGRELEFAWASFLANAMQQGVIPQNDPRLLTRAVLGLYNSIWQWYRPTGIFALEPIGDFFKDRVLAMMGLDPDGVIRPRMVA